MTTREYNGEVVVLRVYDTLIRQMY